MSEREQLKPQDFDITRVNGGFTFENDGARDFVPDAVVRDLAEILAEDDEREAEGEAAAESVYRTLAGTDVPMVAVHCASDIGGRPAHVLRATDIYERWEDQYRTGHVLFRTMSDRYVAGRTGIHQPSFSSITANEAAAWWAWHRPNDPMPTVISLHLLTIS